MGNNPSPPQTVERAASEGRAVSGAGGTHLHGHAVDASGYSHAFFQHSAWSGNDGTANSGPITAGVGNGSASSLTSSSSNEGMPMGTGGGGASAGGGGGGDNHLHQTINSGHSDVYHTEKYKYERLNETDANADNR